MNDVLLVIPAIKKNAVIPDQLIKKLDGTTLIQRAINTALDLIQREHILVVTDSEEISLICERNKIVYFYDSMLTLDANTILIDLQKILSRYAEAYNHLILYRANAPLVNSEVVRSAYDQYQEDISKTVISARQDIKLIYTRRKGCLELQEFENETEIFEEIKAFKILSFNSFLDYNRCIVPYVLPYEKSIEIENYQDWWVYEKILQQKKIVFNVVGSTKIGMGHIFHSLSLAHEITDHEVIFVCDQKYKVAVDKIAATDYRVLSSENIIETILDLNPDLVINDVLNTTYDFVITLKEKQIVVVNFEDLGEGGQLADLVFNELYDEPKMKGKHYLWGYKYMALRDEFYEATPHNFTDEVDSVLITFGGTDQNNLTQVALQAIIETCRQRSIKIFIVCGSGYLYKTELESYIHTLKYGNIEVIYAAGVISKIMEKTQIAISSNGRTVYELADMNIPTIVISHHEREDTHTFASLEKGFINLSIFDDTNTKYRISDAFNKLVEDRDYRKLLFLNITQYSFRENKHKIVKKIMELI